MNSHVIHTAVNGESVNYSNMTRSPVLRSDTVIQRSTRVDGPLPHPSTINKDRDFWDTSRCLDWNSLLVLAEAENFTVGGEPCF